MQIKASKLFSVIVILAMMVAALPVVMVQADSTAQTLPFSQNWSDASLLTVTDSWSGVPGIVGYRGDSLTAVTGVDPQTVLADDTLGIVDINVNQTNPNTNSTGRLGEFAITDPVVAIQGSGTADAPYLLISIDTTGKNNISISYNLRDIDGSTDNAVQPVALQYRVGSSGTFTNVPAGYVADATSGPSLATLVTPVSTTLPAAADNQSLIQVRIITTNAGGNDEWVGIDDISITGSAAGSALSINDVTLAEGDSGTTNFSFTISLSSPAPVGGVTFDVATADGTATTADNDYVGQSLTSQTIAEGSSTYTFDVTVNGDTNTEATEAFSVNVTNVTGATVTDGSGTGTITNDDAVVPALSINDVTVTEGDSGTILASFTVSLNIPAGAGGVTFDIATVDGTATTADSDYVARSLTSQIIAEGVSTYAFDVTVNGDTNVESNETFNINVTNVTGATVSDGAGMGTITNDDIAITLISYIQGSGSTSVAGTFTVEAIVVGDYQTQGTGQLKGFFIQEENSDVDADPATSEGIFVYCNTCLTAVSVGDKVRVTGTSSEYYLMSQLNPTSITVLSSGNTLPTPATLQLPVPGVPTGDLAAATTIINAYYEKFEGMLVTFPVTLSVSEYFELARYGQVILSQGGRPHTFTAVNTPTVLGYTNHQIDLASHSIILDDTDNRENRPVDVPNTAYYHPVAGLSTSNFFRGGDTITNLTGVLHWSFAGVTGTDAWRIRPVTEAYSYAFTQVNPRPAVPSINGRLKVASFNVLNYFLTIDTTNVCAPTLNQDCRGADSTQELDRQRTKMLAALSAIDADVFGFMEMENTPGVEPLADIVAGLPGYGYINTGVIGGDAIRVGIIYKTSTVVPVGNYALLTSVVDPRFDDTKNRPTLAQTFEEIATGERFTVAVNHLKSKGSSCGVGDDDTTTGQGNCNLTRTLAAQALADWLASDPTSSGDPDFLIIGDMNSYAMEDPIVSLKGDGYTDLVAAFGGLDAYGYVFDGQLGYLDHALTNSSLSSQVAGIAEWHINADEIPLFDYNDDARTADEATFEEESDVLPLYEPNEFRTSDHDPIIIGLSLGALPPVATMINRVFTSPNAGDTVNFNVNFSEDVTGVDVTDFALTTSGITGASVTSMSGSGTAYTIVVNTGTGSGTIRLDLIDNDSIKDTITGIALGGPGLLNGDFTTGQVYTIDKNPPVVTAIYRSSSNPTSAASVTFAVTFSKVVTDVDVSDFVLTTTGVSGASIASVTNSGSWWYTVTVNTGTGNGTIRLDLIDNDSIKDIVAGGGNALGGPGLLNGDFTTGQVYTLDHAAPVVTSIARAIPGPTTALGSVNFYVYFSKVVTGVDVSDFALTTTGVSGASITNVTNSGLWWYTVTVNTGTGNGTIRLDLIDNDSIKDTTDTLLGGPGLLNGDFTTGQVYTIDRNPPVVTAIYRASSNPTSAASVTFTVFFSKVVTGVDVSDFALTTTGVSGTSITSVTNSGSWWYTVTVNTGTGNGTIRLDLIDNDSIKDPTDMFLGGSGLWNGDFTTGQVYTIIR